MKGSKLYVIVRPIINLLARVIYRPVFVGTENIPKKGAFVLAGNHTKFLDPVMLLCTNKRVIHFLAKDELLQGKRKIIFNSLGIIPVNRKIHDSSALENAIEALKKGEIIGVFPEATINRTENVILPFKSGAVRMANEADALLVPFTIKGKYRILKKGPIIEFYKPYKVGAEITKENEKLMKIISDNLVKENLNGNF